MKAALWFFIGLYGVPFIGKYVHTFLGKQR